MPIGAALGGLVGETLGLQAVFLIFGASQLLLLLGRLVVTDDAIRAAELPRSPEGAKEPVT
jgi:predicted MFS family arabinose efflux permease